ncbi:MAG: ABC transporter permease [Clostridiaceae bacterium]|nr:ABC transporter permease [Clostridiaceae bacterium]
MKQIITVFRFTFAEAIRKKAFLIITSIVLFLILVACAIPLISGKISAPKDDPSKTIYFVGVPDRLPGAREAIASLYPEAEIINGDATLVAQYSDEVRTDSDKAIIELTESEGFPKIRVTAKTFMSFIDVNQVSDVLTPLFVREEMKRLGASDDLIELSQMTLPSEFIMAGNMDLSGYIIGIALLMIMFFAIYYYGYGVSMSIANEKASRVMETLIVSAKPSHVLIGKCLGMGLLGLAQLSAFLLTAALGYVLLVPKDFTLMGMPLSLSAFTFSSAVLVLLYFVLGYSLYAVMNAVCGALVDKIEDLSSAMMPVMFITMVSFYVGYFTAISGTTNIVSKIAVYVPFSSPFVVPFKLLNSDISISDIVISIVLLLTAVVVVAWFSARLYTASVLHYGKRLRIKDLYLQRK